MPENLNAALSLLDSVNEGALATIEGEWPFVSAVGFLYERGIRPENFGEIYFLLSDLARHTKNILKNSQVSLLAIEGNHKLPIHERKRLTLQGRALRVESKDKSEELKTKYLKIFPKAAIFFTLSDFRFYEMEISELHWIGGFGKAATFR